MASTSRRTAEGSRRHPLIEAALRHQTAGNLAEAEKHLRKLLRSQPGHADASRQLASILTRKGAPQEAVALLSRAASRNPNDAALPLDAAQILRQFGQVEPARHAIEAAWRLQPTDADAALRLAVALLEAFDVERGMVVLRRALNEHPDDHRLHATLGSALTMYGEAAAAIPHFETALRHDPNNSELRINHATVLRTVGRLEDAEAAFRSALATRPDSPRALSGLAETLEARQEHQQAWELLRTAYDGGADDPEVAIAYARAAGRAGQADAGIAALRRVIAAPGVSDSYRGSALIDLGQMLEKRGEIDAAFDAYRKGNGLWKGRFDREGYVEVMQAMREVFDPQRLVSLPHATDSPGGDRPIFIVGMPRSGTSLIEQILSAHPAVFGAGELTFMMEIAQRLPQTLASDRPYPWCISSMSESQATALGRDYLDHLAAIAPGEAALVTDKLPNNAMHVGLISLLLPKARIIHCRRDAMDTCFSIYTTRLAPQHVYAHRLEDIAVVYRETESLMDFWKRTLPVPIFDASYEAFVDDLEGNTRRLLEWLGLPFDEACLRFFEARRQVRTASKDQVNRPIYRSSVGRWKAFERHLDVLKTALGETAE